MKTNVYFWSYLAEFFSQWEVLQTRYVEKIKTRILRLMTFFPRKSCRLWDNVDKYCRAGQTTGYNMALDTKGYK